jgi:NADH dehydrogenase
MNGKLVTIFGGGGFLGRHIVPLLVQAGWVVRVAQRYPDQALFLRMNGPTGQVDLHRTDITRDADIASALEGAQAVINCVGVLTSRGRQSFRRIHRDAPGRIAEQAQRAGISRFIQVSALGADAHSASIYARSKYEGESLVRDHLPTATVMRLGLLIGPEDDFFNRFARMTRFSPFLPLIGGGRTRFQPVLVTDAAQAVVRALEAQEAPGTIYEIAGPDHYSFRNLMVLMLRVLDKRRALIPIPFGVAVLLAAFTQFIPGAPLTLDQVRLLRRDNVLSGTHPGSEALGITPQPLTPDVLAYLAPYR